MRFPGKFDVIYNVEEDMLTCEMLKFILQPLMENAMEHGVIPCKRRGRIEVTGKISSDHIAEISICDNGNGISDEMLQRLHQELKKDLQQGVNPSSSGIGLINVHQRIKNYYGEEFGISVESNQGEYTCVKVRFGIARRGMKMNFKILVADDEYYARKALVMMLEKSELPISVNGDFEDGEEVIEFLQRTKRILSLQISGCQIQMAWNWQNMYRNICQNVQ